MFPGPGFGCKVFYLPVGGRGEPGEDVTQVRIGIDSTTAAAFNDGVEDGAAFSGLGFADEEPILFAERRGPDGIFHKILIYLDASIVEVNTEQRPQVQRVVDGQAHPAARQVTALAFQLGEDAMEPLVNRAGLMSAHGHSQAGTDFAETEFSLDAIQVSDLAQKPACDERVLFPRFKELSPSVRLMWSS